MKARVTLLLTMLVVLVGTISAQSSKRRMTPVETPATITQTVNEARTDSTRILQARMARSTHFHDEQGRVVYVDTVTGEQWIDSTTLIPVVKMKYPLFESASVSVDIWDPLMRAFGQHYGLIGFAAELSLHNRYKPVFEMGFGQADNTPSGNNFSYHSPVSVYFRIGANYNFLYNSSPDYQFYGGLRYGFSSFSYSISDITVNAPYWEETARFDIPSRTASAGWFELVFGLRVKLWGPVSAGWALKYHKILHDSKSSNGQPWYIPGYGARGNALTGSLAITYTFSLEKLNKHKPDEVISTDDQPSVELPPSPVESATE